MIKGWGKIEHRGQYLVASPSKLALLRECPELYKHRYIDGEKEQSDSMDFGSMVHMAILEPEKFNDTYVFLPEPTSTNDLDGKQLKEIAKRLELTQSGTKKELLAIIRSVEPIEKQIEEMQEEIIANGKQVLPRKTHDKVLSIKTKIESHPQLGRFLAASQKEKRGFYQDHNTGVVLSFIADAFLEIGGVGLILDFKFTRNWNTRQFLNSNFDESRHLLAAAYCRALTAIEGKKFDRFVFIAIEPSSPHRMRFYEVDSAMLDAGDAELDFYLADFKKRHENNDWTPRNNEGMIQQTTMPSWAWEKISEVQYE